MTQFVYGLRLKNCIQPWMPPYFNLFSIRAGSPLFSPPRFLTVIENLRPPFLSLSLSLSFPSFLFFFFSFSTRSWAAPGAGICIEQPLSGALDAGLSFPFYRGRGIVRATLACSVGEIVSSLGWNVDVKRPLQANTRAIVR